MKLSDAQIYTLRRMLDGRGYLIRGDGKMADEKRPDGRGWFPVNAPSIPVLYRLGLVQLVTKGTTIDPGKWYAVELTPAGREAAATAKFFQ